MSAVRPPTTLERWSGPAFVVLALVSSTAVSLPLSSDSPARISSLYDVHRTAYVVAQVVGVLGVVMLLVFLAALRRTEETARRSVTAAGLLTAAAALATNAAVLVLCFADLSPDGVHRAAVATDVTDDVLFLAFAALALTLATSAPPRWLRAMAAAASLLCLLRAVDPVVGVPAMESAAPLAVLLVLLVTGVRVLRARPVLPATDPGGQPRTATG